MNLRFPLGVLTRFRSPAGVEYIRGQIGGLVLTLTLDPEVVPAAGGDQAYVAWASAAPGGAPGTRKRPIVIADPGESLSPVASAPPRQSKAQRLEARAREIIDRLGGIPEGGDELGELVETVALDIPLV